MQTSRSAAALKRLLTGLIHENRRWPFELTMVHMPEALNERLLDFPENTQVIPVFHPDTQRMCRCGLLPEWKIDLFAATNRFVEAFSEFLKVTEDAGANVETEVQLGDSRARWFWKLYELGRGGKIGPGLIDDLKRRSGGRFVVDAAAYQRDRQTLSAFSKGLYLWMPTSCKHCSQQIMVLGDHNLENLKQLAAACDQDLEDAAIAQYKAKSRSARVAVASLRRLRRPEARDWTSLLMEHYAWHIKDPYLVTIAGLEYLVRHPSAIGVEEGKPRRTTQRTTQGSPRGGGGRPNECQARHSEDFSSVYWYGEHYSFSRLQARCVKVLWEAWTNGTPELHQATILDEAGSLRDQQRLAVIFRPHSAWRRMIVPGSRKGTFKLQTLSGPPDPSEKQNIGKTST